VHLICALGPMIGSLQTFAAFSRHRPVTSHGGPPCPASHHDDGRLRGTLDGSSRAMTKIYLMYVVLDLARVSSLGRLRRRIP
jgi:hypothetical protein